LGALEARSSELAACLLPLEARSSPTMGGPERGQSILRLHTRPITLASGCRPDGTCGDCPSTNRMGATNRSDRPVSRRVGAAWTGRPSSGSPGRPSESRTRPKESSHENAPLVLRHTRNNHHLSRARFQDQCRVVSAHWCVVLISKPNHMAESRAAQRIPRRAGPSWAAAHELGIMQHLTRSGLHNN
jgi:hypothetical protein